MNIHTPTHARSRTRTYIYIYIYIYIIIYICFYSSTFILLNIYYIKTSILCLITSYSLIPECKKDFTCFNCTDFKNSVGYMIPECKTFHRCARTQNYCVVSLDIIYILISNLYIN